MIRCVMKGNFKYTESWLNQLRKRDLMTTLVRCGDMGIQALSAATPRKTGTTAESWYYDVVVTEHASTIVFKNRNTTEHHYTTKKGEERTSNIPVVVLIQYGHSYNGAFVAGRDFITPTLQPIFDKIAKEAWEEVTAR